MESRRSAAGNEVLRYSLLLLGCQFTSSNRQRKFGEKIQVLNTLEEKLEYYNAVPVVIWVEGNFAYADYCWQNMEALILLCEIIIESSLTAR